MVLLMRSYDVAMSRLTRPSMMTTPDVVLNTKDWHADDPQSVHSPDPDAALCLPAAHPTHGPPSGPLKPALHRHAAAVALADAEYELAGHPTHALADVAFVVAKYLPLAQLVHAADPVDAL